MLWIFIFFVGGGWFLGKILASLLPKETSIYQKEPDTIINNYTSETHNHLHITENEFKKIKSQ